MLRGVATSSLLLVCSMAGGAVGGEAARPSDGALVLAGAGMAVPTYVLFVVLHEGAHAVAAQTFGAEVTGFHILPNVRDGHFFFGYTEWRGSLSPAALAVTLLAPKATDAVLLAGYAALVAAGGLPANHYGKLGLTVVATGAWIDFARDVVAFRSVNDTMRVYALGGLTRERQRLPWRLLHALVAAAAAIPICQGYRQTFARPQPVPIVVPLLALPL
jgi:hypothetical protein